MLKINIPTPCHEDWGAMTPNQQGRYCTACAKTVVDFTLMTDEAIKYFLLHQQEKTVCGRFKNEQLQRITISLPANILQIHLPLWKQFLTACLLTFSSMLFSCNAVIDNNNLEQAVLGEPNKIPVAMSDSTPVRVGMFFTVDTTYSVDPPNTCTATMGDTINYSQGVTIVEAVLPTQIMEDIVSPVPVIDPVYKKGEIATSIPDSTTTKNPPKADSIDCNDMKYY